VGQVHEGGRLIIVGYIRRLPTTEMACGRALEEAARMICILKCGRCPLGEKTFQGCPCECNEEVRPWQCWVAHLMGLARAAGTQREIEQGAVPAEAWSALA